MIVVEYMGVEIDTPEDLERAAKLIAIREKKEDNY
jgi:choline kinase